MNRVHEQWLDTDMRMMREGTMVQTISAYATQASTTMRICVSMRFNRVKRITGANKNVMRICVACARIRIWKYVYAMDACQTNECVRMSELVDGLIVKKKKYRYHYTCFCL